MFKFTKTGVLYVSTIIIFILIQIFTNQYKIKTEINEEIMEEKQEFFDETNFEQTQVEEPESIEKSEDSGTRVTEENQDEKEIWQIEIPKISLIANIKEGTTKDILKQYVGHFKETQKENGNIGLAAHNRGYEVNYFQDLKLLKEGDEIKYKHNEFEKIYEVEKCRIIKDTEWEYLDNTEENMLTLITCVENEPEYRRCIQALEKEEEIY